MDVIQGRDSYRGDDSCRVGIMSGCGDPIVAEQAKSNRQLPNTANKQPLGKLFLKYVSKRLLNRWMSRRRRERWFSWFGKKKSVIGYDGGELTAAHQRATPRGTMARHHVLSPPSCATTLCHLKKARVSGQDIFGFNNTPIPRFTRPATVSRNSCLLPFSAQSVAISRILRTHGINTYFSNSNSIGAILRHPITRLPRSTVAQSSGGSVYSVSCNDCSASYIGETENNVRYIPSSPTQVNLNIIQEEVGEGQVLDQTTLIQNSETMLNLEFIVRYSTMTKLIRITAWCWRFYYNCLLFDPIRQKGPLTTRELTKAIQVLVKSIQQVEFCTEIKLLKSNKQLPLSNKLTPLNPFLDTQGLLRVGGRLKYSYLNENKKFPLLQPKSPRQESLIKNLLTENADIPEAIDENQEDSSILETTFVIEDEESNKDIGTPKIEISEVSVIDKSEGKYSKEPVVSVEALDKKELCHDDSAHLNVVEADLNRPKEATSGIINVYTEANESSSKEKVVPVEIVDTSTKDYLQSGEKAKLSRWKPIDSLCLEDVKESEDDDENYSSSAYIEWPEILKKEVLRPEALEKAVNLEDFEKVAESRQLSKEHLEESTEQGSCIKAESKPWEDPIESDLAAAESDNPAVPERELANESENLIQDSPQSDTQRWKLIPLPFKQ
ncbi:hypothetical protein LAZ67_5000435 [Cordylochernes scorpioides]|uniref:Uncharacterized protein n=1 Tax=Cordylochernes scorpioides TaxID=51811 RepID=A0ABY6KHW3_9ARAC|nr:hypothetical protein LAZ67_5000435 [Cordylochernes scorpioides]